MSVTISENPGAARYGRASIALHWLMLIVIAAIYACMELSENFPKGSDLRVGLKNWHFMLGLSVLMLVAVRMVLRLSSATPPIQPAPPRWQVVPSRLMLVALYALMIGMPLLGWLTLSAEGQAIPFFFVQLPALVNESKSVAKWAKDLHETGAGIGYFLIGMHAAAALFHHYFVRDNTLRRMLPY
ncbi:cytochrome b [Polaromonas sp.]|uniref:cytochrome b n=1 Tax=Polaromonas sp. TaxID=1869339 RepID=UPI0024882BCA|nr:cytochrome b [Polaromonas sp.]MDI1272886.1 cytochrome b [Polaromonas sp.]